jgi:ankyrin repeat protein
MTLEDKTAEYWFPDARARELALAAARGEADRVAALVRGGVAADAAGRDGITPLVWAVRARSAEGVRALLANGADPNGRGGPPGYVPLHMAAEAPAPGLLRAFLDAKADPNRLDEPGGDRRSPGPSYTAASTTCSCWSSEAPISTPLTTDTKRQPCSRQTLTSGRLRRFSSSTGRTRLSPTTTAGRSRTLSSRRTRAR